MDTNRPSPLPTQEQIKQDQMKRRAAKIDSQNREHEDQAILLLASIGKFMKSRRRIVRKSRAELEATPMEGFLSWWEKLRYDGNIAPTMTEAAKVRAIRRMDRWLTANPGKSDLEAPMHIRLNLSLALGLV